MVRHSTDICAGLQPRSAGRELQNDNCKLQIANLQWSICNLQLLAFGLSLLLSATALAQDPAPTEPLREIFVPFEDLNIILEGPTQRVFLTRQERMVWRKT